MDTSDHLNTDSNPIQIDLHHPEILTCAQLKQLLIQHNVPENCWQEMEKEKLVDLYRKVILPLPQRTYRQNRRGKLLTQQQKKQEKEKHVECNMKLTKLNLSDSRLSNLPAPKSSSSQSRLKPPPTPIVFNDKKVVQISKSPTNTCLENGTMKRNSNVHGGENSNKIIRLINRTLANPDNKKKTEILSNHKRNAEKSPEVMEIDTPKKKHKPITWP